jgi:two-component sensor histidine kinase
MYRVLGELPQKLRRWPPWRRHGTAVAAALVAVALRYVLLGPGGSYAYITAFPAVVLVAVLLGVGPGLVCSLLAGIAAAYLLVSPAGTLFFADSADALAFVLYLLSCGAILFATQILHSALDALGVVNDRLAQQSAESHLLLREAAHRRQNDLARLIATLKLQATLAEKEGAREALEEASGRIMALARVDRVLVQTDKGNSVIDARDFLAGVMDDVAQAGSVPLRPIAIDLSLQSCLLPKERVLPLGLIATELISNALKYAFPDGRAGHIRFSFRREGAEYVLGVEDDGVGFRPSDPAQGTGLGRTLVKALAAQLNGRLEITGQSAAGGASIHVHFPAEGGADGQAAAAPAATQTA